jgi:hypothetical protein
MPHLTIADDTAAGAVILVVGIIIGWGGGRAYQRAFDAWWRFRNHVRMTRSMYVSARTAIVEAAGTIGLTVVFVAAACVAAWLLLAR